MSAQPTQEKPRIPFLGEGEVVVDVRGISLWYGPVIGINNISVQLGKGVIGLLGPNGAGKSTFMKCMTGQLQPKTGRVTIGGQPVWNNASVFAKLGLVPEQDAFYEEMSGLEFVTYLTRLQGFDAKTAKELALEAVETVSMTDKMDQRIREYSKGMRQRIKIAQALAHKPDVLFMDEPLTGTDPVGRRYIIDLIRRMGEQGKTILVSSHVLNEVEQMTTNILLINKGRLLADGNVYRIREMIDEQPHTIYIGCAEPRRLASLLLAHEDILQVRFDEEAGLEIKTHQPDACYTRIPKVALENNIRIERIHSPDNNLMAVFKYLVG